MKGQPNALPAGEPLQKALRNRMTDAEQRLWRRLRGRQLAGCKFRRQHPFLHYILDFVCLEKSLVVEVDGGQHLDNANDRLRDRCLAAAGFHVLRFWNNQVLQETDAVLEVILAALNAGPNRPSPFKGEDRRGMGSDAGTVLSLSSGQPHLPPGLPLEGGGEERA